MIILIQVLQGICFLFLSLVSFTFVGFPVLRRFDFDFEDLEKFVLSTVFGMVLFTLSAYLLAALNLRFLMWVLPFFGFLSFIKLKNEVFKFRPKISYKAFFLSVFIIGVIGQVAVNAPSGLPYKDGIYFYSSHGHDGVWHMALMQEMQKSIFPFQNPELSGYKLQNYHFFADLLMSEFSRLFHFSNLDIYFRFMPLVFSILLGLSSFIFVRAWGKSEVAGIWAMFFTYFAGSFGYLLYIPTHRNLGGESIFWVSQTQSVLGNPPHAAAFIIVAAALLCLLRYLSNRKISYFFLFAILCGSVIEFKVYAGVLLLGGLFFLSIFELFKKSFSLLMLFLITLALGLIIYLPNSANSQDFLIWQPWWFIRTMVVAPDRLNWLDLELRRQTYVSENNWKRVIQLEATAFLIFLFGNLGMRFLGFWAIFKQVRHNIFKNSFNLFFLVITLASFFIPVFFLQKGVAWNTIQFNQYFLLFFGFLAALSIPSILKLFSNTSWKILISVMIILLAVPTQLGLLWQFYSNPPLSKISFRELEALDFLKKTAAQTDKILVPPFNKYERDKYSYPPVPIYSWYDTGYVSAFSGKQTLISDEEQVNIMGYDVEELVKERQEVFQSIDPNQINSFLYKYKVDFIYLPWGQKFATDSAKINIESIFENKDARVYKVRK